MWSCFCRAIFTVNCNGLGLRGSELMHQSQYNSIDVKGVDVSHLLRDCPTALTIMSLNVFGESFVELSSVVKLPV